MGTLTLTKLNLNSFEKLLYAVLGHNSSIQSVTKHKLIEINTDSIGNVPILRTLNLNQPVINQPYIQNRLHHS